MRFLVSEVPLYWPWFRLVESTGCAIFGFKVEGFDNKVDVRLPGPPDHHDDTVDSDR